MPNNLTLALGTLPATPLEVATGYAAFANGGYRVDSYFVESIEDAAGVVVYQAKPKVVCEGVTVCERRQPPKEVCDRAVVPATRPAAAPGAR